VIPGLSPFKPLELADRETLRPAFREYGPETSEWTFTNFYIWRLHYRFEWSRYGDLLVFLCRPKNQDPFLLMPLGPGPRADAARDLLRTVAEETGAANLTIQKADARFAAELADRGEFSVEPQRDHFDYLYDHPALASLAGRKLHSKKNHLNRFEKSYPDFRYAPLGAALIPECLGVLDRWNQSRSGGNNPVLLAEAEAVREALAHFDALQLRGGAILIGDRVEAFTIGSELSADTAVVHVEKADPEIPGLFTAINQRFASDSWTNAKWINREQDLGEEGLRKAKLSYHPLRLVEKFAVRLL
jgi:uncharacterized protein